MLYKEFNMDEALETRGEECFEKGKIDLAKSLLEQGFSEEVILRATGLSHEELANK